MSRGLTNRRMKTLTLTLSLRERELPSPSRGGGKAHLWGGCTPVGEGITLPFKGRVRVGMG